MEEPRRKTAIQCRSAMRKAVMAEFDELIEGFLKEARKGSCAHIKFAVELLRPEPRTSAQSGTSGAMRLLLEELQRDPPEGIPAMDDAARQPPEHRSESFLV